jgi:hypothetical protein
MTGQRSLINFYQSVRFQNPALADQIHEDVILVGIGSLCEDKSQVQDCVERLRDVAFDLPVIFARVLDGALEEMGFDLAGNSSP